MAIKSIDIIKRNERLRNRPYYEPITSAEISHENASFSNKMSGKRFGKVFFSCQGILNILELYLSGNINIQIASINKKMNLSYNKRTNKVIINYKGRDLLSGDLLFRYTGNLISIGIANVWGYRGSHVRAKIIRNSLLIPESSNMKISKDTTVFKNTESIYSINYKSNGEEGDDGGSYSGISQLKMAEDYIDAKDMQNNNYIKQSSNVLDRLPEHYTKAMQKKELCGNCHFLVRKNFCNLWRGLIKTNHLCDSWLGHNPSNEEIDEKKYRKELGEEQ